MKGGSFPSGRLLGVGVSVILLAMVMGHTSVPSGSTDLVPTAVGGTCILGCKDMFTGDGLCDDYHHVAPEEGDYAEYGGGYHNTTCFEGNCNCGVVGPDGEDVEAEHRWCPWNPDCAGGGGGESFAQALRGGEERDIRAALADGGEALKEAVRIVPERGAVQLVDCEGKIAAHFPVQDRTLHLMAELVAQ